MNSKKDKKEEEKRHFQVTYIIYWNYCGNLIQVVNILLKEKHMISIQLHALKYYNFEIYVSIKLNLFIIVFIFCYLSICANYNNIENIVSNLKLVV